MLGHFNTVLQKYLRSEDNNYERMKKVLGLKHEEFDKIIPFITNIMQRLNKLMQETKKQEVRFLGIIKEYSKEVDPSKTYKLVFKVGKVQKMTIVFPILTNNGTFLIHGSEYNPVIQMIDKPIVYRMDGNIKFHSNVLTLRTDNMTKPDAKAYISSYVKFKPLLLPFFVSLMGLDSFQKFLDIELIVKNKSGSYSLVKEILLGNIYWKKGERFKKQYNSERMNMILNQLSLFPKEIEKILGTDRYENVPANRILSHDFWINLVNKYDEYNNVPYEKIKATLELVPQFDTFTKEYMKFDTVVEEFLDSFKKDDIQDCKDITNKRFRCLECYLSIFLNYIFSLAINLKLRKKINFTKDKRIRLDDTISNIELALYTYRYNTMMELSENAKITQVGLMGYDRQIFIGSKRDIHESQYGMVCPISTPDRENCGVVLHIALFSKIGKFNEHYKWPKNKFDKNYMIELEEGEEI